MTAFKILGRVRRAQTVVRFQFLCLTPQLSHASLHSRKGNHVLRVVRSGLSIEQEAIEKRAHIIIIIIIIVIIIIIIIVTIIIIISIF